MNLKNNSPCRYCTESTGRKVGCKSTCEKLVSYEILGATTLPPKKNYKDKSEKLGNFMGYVIYPNGKIRGKKKDWINAFYIRGKPYVHLCDMGLTFTYPLDKVIWRAYHCDFYIDGYLEPIHIDGDLKNCRIDNLRM